MTANDTRARLDAELAKLKEVESPLEELGAIDGEIAALEREVEAAGHVVGPRAVVVDRLRAIETKRQELELLRAARESIEAAAVNQAAAADALEDSARRLAAEVVDAEVAAVQKRVAELGQRILAEAARLAALREVADASPFDARFAPVAFEACGVSVGSGELPLPSGAAKERERLRAALGEVVDTSRRASALAERLRDLARSRFQRARQERHAGSAA